MSHGIVSSGNDFIIGSLNNRVTRLFTDRVKKIYQVLVLALLQIFSIQLYLIKKEQSVDHNQKKISFARARRTRNQHSETSIKHK